MSTVYVVGLGPGAEEHRDRVFSPFLGGGF